jgi:hypothetical protein
MTRDARCARLKFEEDEEEEEEEAVRLYGPVYGPVKEPIMHHTQPWAIFYKHNLFQ